MRGYQRSLWLLPLLLLAAAVSVQSCSARGPAPAPEPPRPTMNHAKHLAADLLCTDCHDPEETGEPALPKAETCFECHDDLEGESDRVKAYFDHVRQADGTYVFPKLPYSADLKFVHKTHLEYGAKCEECHGEPSEAAFGRKPLFELKKSCMDCHREKGASNDCAVCHHETRKEKKPASHDAGFLGRHGREAPEGWQEGRGATCALCHSVPQDCQTCHQQSKPASHGEAGFRLFHGQGYTDALDGPFEASSCALCHEEQSCNLCHQTNKPRSHTTVFMRRTHGIQSAVERQSCLVCHKQETCNRCHQTTQPVSHRGSFSSGQQTHCIACHEPLQATGCFACHKNTLGHLQAGAPPLDAAHNTASDPVDCESCHPTLPHLYGGGSCRRCHR